MRHIRSLERICTKYKINQVDLIYFPQKSNYAAVCLGEIILSLLNVLYISC